MKDKLLRFNENGKFKILCISDIHAGIGYNKNLTSVYLRSLLSKTEPDIVLMLGDIAGPGEIHIETENQLREMLESLTEPLTSRRIYWANVFGNHDDNFGVSNENAQGIYESFDYCLSKAGEKDIAGTGNYTLTVYGHDGEAPKFNIFAFDSHGSMSCFEKSFNLTSPVKNEEKDVEGLDFDDKGADVSQVVWYYNTSKEFEKTQGRVLPALAVMHIPIPEMKDAARSPEENGLEGIFGESVSCSGLNNGLFRACLERGDIKNFCFGHDHSNNFSVNYCGITLSYDGYLSCHADHKINQLGGRIYELSEKTDGTVDVTSEFVPALPVFNK